MPYRRNYSRYRVGYLLNRLTTSKFVETSEAIDILYRYEHSAIQHATVCAFESKTDICENVISFLALSCFSPVSMILAGLLIIKTLTAIAFIWYI